jgi:hypothetical protein
MSIKRGQEAGSFQENITEGLKMRDSIRGVRSPSKTMVHGRTGPTSGVPYTGTEYKSCL